MPYSDQRGGRSILLVEDDAVSRNALVHILGRLGYLIIPVATVADSLTLLDGQDFAILDLELPDGAGTQILQRIRDEGLPIRVAITTGTQDQALVREAQRLHAELVLHKPIHVNELIQWLGSEDARQPAAQELGPH